MPIASNIGPTSGTTINVISIKSRIKPKKKISNITTRVAETTPPGRLISSCSINSSPPKPLNTDEKIVAPTRIRYTIEVTRIVSMLTDCSTETFSALLIKARTIAPTAPMLAASVGVAIPISIEPNTATMSSTGGSKPLNNAAKTFAPSPNSSLAIGGACEGFSIAMTNI